MNLSDLLFGADKLSPEQLLDAHKHLRRAAGHLSELVRAYEHEIERRLTHADAVQFMHEVQGREADFPEAVEAWLRVLTEEGRPFVITVEIPMRGENLEQVEGEVALELSKTPLSFRVIDVREGATDWSDGS